MKKLPLLTILLIVIIGLIVVTNQLANKQPAENSLLLFPQFAKEECGSITIRENQNTVTLMRKGAVWVVITGNSIPASGSPLVANDATKTGSASEYPVDSAAMQTALEKLKALSREELISQNIAKQSEYEVDTTKGIRVDVKSDKGALWGTVYIGKNGSDWSTNFIRANGSNDVYLAGGSVKYAFFADHSRWKDKTIISFGKPLARSIVIAKKDTTIQLSFSAADPKDTTKKAGWKIVSPLSDSAKNAEVDKILNTASAFNAASFEDNNTLTDDSMGISKPYLTLTIALDNGSKKLVVIGKEKGTEGKRWVKTPDKNATFLVDKYTIDNIDRSLNALRGIEEKKQENKPAIPKSKKKTK